MAFGASPVGNRIIAAAQALGAPKGVEHKAAGKPGLYKGPFAPKPQGNAPRLPNKSAGKTKQMPRANPHPNHPGQGQPAHAGPTRQQYPGGGDEVPLAQQTPAQTQHLALKLAQAQGKTELAPLQNQAKEITGTEAAVQNRFKALGEAQQSNLSNIVSQGETSAKTAQNKAADLALQSGRSVETSGQTQAGLTGGYLAPETRQALAAQGQRTAETSGTNRSLAEQSGQNEVNLLTNLRAAAAAKVTEGAQGIASTYGKQYRENQAKQGEVAGKTAANFQKLATELPQRAFNEKATEVGLGIKKEAPIVKAKETAAKINATRAGQREAAGTSRANAKERNAVSEANNRRTTETAAADTQKRLEAAAAKRSAATGKPSATSNKLFSELGTAASQVQKFRSGKKPLTEQAIREAISSGQTKEAYKVTSKSGKPETKIRIARGKAVGNQVLINAALEVWNKHEISSSTRAQLTKMGYPPGTGAELTQELYNYVPPKEPNRRGARPA